MSEDGFRISRLEEIPELDDGRCPWRPVRHHLGITAFGVNGWTGRASGDRIVNEHSEEGEGGEEELYVVLSGRARFEVADEEIDAPAGTLVFVGPGVRRTAFAAEPETTILAVGAVAGEAYEPSGWEVWGPSAAAANGFYERGEYEQAAEAFAALAREHPEYPAPLYNLACCESLAGRREDAVEHLRRAVEAAERFRRAARADSDFDPIREDPRFQEIVGGA